MHARATSSGGKVIIPKLMQRRNVISPTNPEINISPQISNIDIFILSKRL